MSFAINNPSQPMQDMQQAGQLRVSPASSAPAGGGFSVTPGSAAAAAESATSKTGTLLMKVAQDLLAPKVQAEAQRQFFEGMQQAMSGQALDEIIDQSPWYANIFGPSAGVQGARHYTQEATVAEWAGRIEQQMPELAKLNPEEASRKVFDELQSMLPQDAMASGEIMQMAVKMAGPIMKQQTKAHVAYSQNKANEQQLNSWGAQADTLNSILVDGTSSPEDMQSAKLRFLDMIQPFEGQSEDSYNKNIVTLLEGSAARGLFFPMAIFQETKLGDSSGETLWDRLPYDLKVNMESRMPQYARAAVDRALAADPVGFAMLVNDTAQDPRAIADRVAAYNQSIADKTGVPLSMAQAIPYRAVPDLVGGVLRAQAAAANQADSSGAKLTAAYTAFKAGPGILSQAKNFGLTDRASVEQVLAAEWQASAGDPRARAALLQSNRSEEMNFLGIQVGTELTPDYNDAVLAHANVVRAMGDDPAGYPPEALAKLTAFNNKVDAGMAPEAAWALAPVQVELGKSNIPERDLSDFNKQLTKVIKSEHPSWTLLGFKFGNELTDSSARMAHAMLNQNMKPLAGLGQETALKAAYYESIRTGSMEPYGQHMAIVASPKEVRPIQQILPYKIPEINDALGLAMESKAKSAGIPLGNDNYTLVRMPDHQGEAVFSVSTYDTETGKPYAFTLTSSEIGPQINEVLRLSVGSHRSDLTQAPPEGIIPIGGTPQPNIRFRN